MSMFSEIINPFLNVRNQIKNRAGQWVDKTIEPNEVLRHYTSDGTDFTDNQMESIFNVTGKKVIIDQLTVAMDTDININIIPSEYAGVSNTQANISQAVLNWGGGGVYRGRSSRTTTINGHPLYEKVMGENEENPESHTITLKRPIILPNGGELRIYGYNASGEASWSIVTREITI